jgi:hypothetical protein
VSRLVKSADRSPVAPIRKLYADVTPTR